MAQPLISPRCPAASWSTRIPGREFPASKILAGWDLIPGARGCSPQSCAFRDHFAELKALGVDRLFGLSTQDTAYQREAADRLHLPFPILSDEHLRLTGALRLPTFQTSGMTLLKRLTLVILDGKIEHVFYPVFPPDRNASDVMAWLTARNQIRIDCIELRRWPASLRLSFLPALLLVSSPYLWRSHRCARKSNRPFFCLSPSLFH